MDVRVYEPMNIIQLYGRMHAFKYGHVPIFGRPAARGSTTSLGLVPNNARLPTTVRVGVRLSEVHGDR